LYAALPAALHCSLSKAVEEDLVSGVQCFCGKEVTVWDDITDLVVMVTIINVWCMSLMKMLEKQSLLGSDKNNKKLVNLNLMCSLS
jgi:hypothetical protein